MNYLLHINKCHCILIVSYCILIIYHCRRFSVTAWWLAQSLWSWVGSGKSSSIRKGPVSAMRGPFSMASWKTARLMARLMAQGLKCEKKDSGWCFTSPSEKYKSQLGVLFPIYGKIKAMFQTTNQLRVQRFCLPPDNITSTILIFMDKSLWFTVIYMLPPRWSGWSLPNMGTVRTGKMVRKSWILWAAHFQIRIWKIRYLSLDRCRVHPDHAAVEPSLNHGAWWVQHDVVALWPAK